MERTLVEVTVEGVLDCELSESMGKVPEMD